MTAFTIYIIITVIAIGIYYLGIEPMLNQIIKYGIIRRMLWLELTNDIVNTTVFFKKINIENKNVSQSNIIHDSILSRQLSDTKCDTGEALVLFIEKWIMFDARERQSTYRFYANEGVYYASINPDIQYSITLWIKKILESNPDHISMQLVFEKNVFKLIFNELVIKDIKIKFATYLVLGSLNKLPGNLNLLPDNKIEISFEE